MKLFQYKCGGGMVETADESAAVVYFRRMGGRFLMRAHHDQFHRLFIPIPQAYEVGAE